MMALAKSCVPTAGFLGSPKSPVWTPLSRAPSRAFSIVEACFRRPMWRSIMRPERRRAVGLARPRPAMSGAGAGAASEIEMGRPVVWEGGKPRAAVRAGAGAAVDGLEDRDVAADVCGGREAEAADEAGREVAHDVALEVGQHDHLVLLGLHHQVHAEGVDDDIGGLDLGEVGGAGPEAVEEEA